MWRDIAQNGNGRFIPIPQDGGQVVIIETPYDEDIIILQREINGTVIPYGPGGLQKRTEDKTRQLVAGRCRRTRAGFGDGELSQQARQGVSEAVTGDGDLVADVNAGRTSFSRHQGRRPAGESARDEAGQRADEVNKQMASRKALNDKLAALVAKRDKYVAEQREKAPPKASSFDRVVEETLKAQIKR